MHTHIQRKHKKDTHNIYHICQARRSVYVGDSVDVSFHGLLGFKTTKKGQVTKITGDAVTVRLTSGEEKVVKKGDCKIQTARSAIDAWPDAFIFFDRVLQLLRGYVCVCVCMYACMRCRLRGARLMRGRMRLFSLIACCSC
jgi:hypothetical protein